MKARGGFVSNSSTTSFCIYGVYFEDLHQLVEDNQKLKEAILKQDPETDLDNYGDYDMSEVISDIVGLPYYPAPYDNDGAFFGRKYSTIDDDETGAEFKKSIRDSIKEFIEVEDKDFGTHDEAWRDG